MSEHSFLIEIRDAGLRQAWRKTLLELAMLSSAPTLHFEASTSHGKPGGNPPPGARPGRFGPPPKDRSLYEWYEFHLRQMVERDPEDPRISRLLFQAKSDYQRAIHQSPNTRKGRDESDDGPESDDSFTKRLAQWYEGVDAEEVAFVYERVRVEVVHKARRVMGLDPNTGRKAHLGWHDWSEERKRLELARFAGTQQQASGEYGVSIRTIKRYWPKQTAA